MTGRRQVTFTHYFLLRFSLILFLSFPNWRFDMLDIFTKKENVDGGFKIWSLLHHVSVLFCIVCLLSALFSLLGEVVECGPYFRTKIRESATFITSTVSCPKAPSSCATPGEATGCTIVIDPDLSPHKRDRESLAGGNNSGGGGFPCAQEWRRILF